MSVKTILIAHQSPAVRDRFAAALADARQEYVVAGSEATLRSALSAGTVVIDLALLDLALGGASDPVTFVTEVRGDGPRQVPVVVFAGSVTSAALVELLAAAGVGGYVNEHAESQHIMPSLAPHLFPDNFNRRAGERVSVSLPISFRAGQTIAAAQTRDVSPGGVGIRTMEPLPGGTPLLVTLKLPGESRELSSYGRVVWSDRRVGMGVQFDRLTPEVQALLAELLEE
jgi:uncharacterized protein (TIGR02266 family)